MIHFVVNARKVKKNSFLHSSSEGLDKFPCKMKACSTIRVNGKSEQNLKEFLTNTYTIYMYKVYMLKRRYDNSFELIDVILISLLYSVVHIFIEMNSTYSGG